ncbi:MAG: hypothetical protein FWC16_14910 [Defluviitaleaceae bacterium]|nr:hypothetical protein [Defluviitaleaceae bacterium]
MRIVWYEIRKIWNLRLVGMVVLFCALFFLALGVQDSLRMVRYPHPLGTQTQRAHDYLEAAPHDLREMLSQEYLDWQRQFFINGMASDCLYTFRDETMAALLLEANAFITQTPIFAAYDIYAIKSPMDRWEQAEAAGATAETHNLMFRALFGESSGFVGKRIENVQALGSNLRDFGESQTRVFMAGNLARANQRELDERQRQRLAEILENSEYTGTLHGSLFWGVTDLFRHVTVILLMASLILHSPLVTTDRVRNMHYLQYHTQLGRRVVVRQFWATLLSAIMLTTIVLVAVGAYLANVGAFAYLGEGITSHRIHFGTHSIAAGFTPITFGSYILVLAGLCYGFSIGAAAIGFILSRFSRNIISLTIKILPVFIAMAFLHGFLLPDRWSWFMVDRFTAPLTLWNHLYIRTGFAYLDVMIIVAFAGVAMLAAAVVSWRDKRVELL